MLLNLFPSVISGQPGLLLTNLTQTKQIDFFGTKYCSCRIKYHNRLLQMNNLFLVFSNQSTNFNIFYKEPFNNSERCNWYGKDGNNGLSYSCNQTGQIVAIRRWDTEVLSVCNIKVYGGK